MKNQKSSALFLLSEADARGNNFTFINELPEFTTCQNPSCNKPVNTEMIIKGAYDGDEAGPYINALPYTILSIIGSVLIMKFVFHWALIVALIAGVFTGCIIGYILWNGIARALKYILFFVLFSAAGKNYAQRQTSYADIILNDPSVKWAAEYQTLVNLTPETNKVSLKKWYLDLLKKASVKNYFFNDDGSLFTRHLRLPELITPLWLKNYYVVPDDNLNNWSFSSRQGSGSIRVLPELKGDSCCGCDESDAFSIKQVLVYKEGKFLTGNILISPLCVRKKDEDLANWYLLGNFAYNTGLDRSISAKYLTTSEVFYHINPRDRVAGFKMLSEGDPDLFHHLFKDLRAGKLAAYDPETNLLIPFTKLLMWKMPVDTVMVYDINGEASTKLLQNQIEPSDLAWMKVKQKWYFDFTSEKLYSEVISVTLFRELFSNDGKHLGMKPFCKLVNANSKP